MLIEDFRIAFQNSLNSVVSWNSSATTNVSWIYSNGGLSRGPLYLGTLERQMTIPFIDGVTKAIEIHDFDDGTIVTPPIEIKPNIRPVVKWVASATAVRYKIFHTPFGGSEKLIYNKLAEGEKIQYQITLTAPLPAGWNFFRVEAVDQFGNESVRSNWSYLVFNLPAPADDLAIVDGSDSGLFDISIT